MLLYFFCSAGIVCLTWNGSWWFSFPFAAPSDNDSAHDGGSASRERTRTATWKPHSSQWRGLHLTALPLLHPEWSKVNVQRENKRVITVDHNQGLPCLEYIHLPPRENQPDYSLNCFGTYIHKVQKICHQRCSRVNLYFICKILVFLKKKKKKGSTRGYHLNDNSRFGIPM